jgi:hypothetical protein
LNQSSKLMLSSLRMSCRQQIPQQVLGLVKPQQVQQTSYIITENSAIIIPPTCRLLIEWVRT